MLKDKIKYQDVEPEFEKDRGYEEFIESFNDYLVPFEQYRYRELEEKLPNVHVIGVPRSGTTLLLQLIISHFSVGYINNFIARFWKAPVSGIRISRNLWGDDYKSELSSELGSTDRVRGPNEFNYFWYDMLGYRGHLQKSDEQAAKIDWQRVAKVLKNMTWAFEKPIVFKSFMLGWHARWLQQQLDKTCFIWIRRDPTDNALSLLDMRRKLFGTIDKWASFKPKNYDALKELSPYEQVAGQVFYLEKAYEKQLKKLPESNYVVFDYKDICREPQRALKTIKSLINLNGGHLTATDYAATPQQPSTKSAETHSDYEKVHDAVRSFYS